MSIDLFPYQIRGVKRIIRHNWRTLLADEMGLGKTAQALRAAKELPGKDPIVVVCPASIKWNWEREVKKFIGLRTQILEGTKPPADFQLKRNTVTILNYDILGAWKDVILEGCPKLIISDECHYLKSRQAKRTKFMKAITAEIPHFIAMSGTPMTNRPAELWPVLNMLWPDEFPSFFPFGNRYCQPEHTPWGLKYNGAERLDELHLRLKKCGMIRRKKSQVLKDLPAKTITMLPLGLKPAARKTYTEVEKDFIGWLRRTSPNRGSSARKNERKSKFAFLKKLIGQLKVEPVKEWIDLFLEDSQNKLITFGWHRSVMEQFQQIYGKQSVMVNGSVIGPERQRRIDSFTLNKKVRLFFGNIQAAGVGWNGTVANTVAFAEFGWSPGEHSQAIDRAHRIGQKKPVSAYFLYVQNTIEDHLVKMINKKQGFLDQALDGGKNEGSLNLVFDQLEDELLRRR